MGSSTFSLLPFTLRFIMLVRPVPYASWYCGVTSLRHRWRRTLVIVRQRYYRLLVTFMQLLRRYRHDTVRYDANMLLPSILASRATESRSNRGGASIERRWTTRTRYAYRAGPSACLRMLQMYMRAAASPDLWFRIEYRFGVDSNEM